MKRHIVSAFMQIIILTKFILSYMIMYDKGNIKTTLKGKHMNLKHILIIDDDVPIGDMLNETLTKEGYQVSRAYSGTEAMLILKDINPDLILLDLMLPGLTGEEVLPALTGIPVIVISAKADIDNKVELLLGGAVDYVTKPFHMKELLARISVHLRTFESHEEAKILSFEKIRLYPDTHQVTVSDKEIKLTRTEYAILKLLLQNQNQVIPKSLILDKIAQDTPDCTESSLKMHISNLRKKIRSALSEEEDYIENVWGIGFCLKKQ